MGQKKTILFENFSNKIPIIIYHQDEFATVIILGTWNTLEVQGMQIPSQKLWNS